MDYYRGLPPYILAPLHTYLSYEKYPTRSILRYSYFREVSLLGTQPAVHIILGLMLLLAVVAAASVVLLGHVTPYSLLVYESTKSCRLLLYSTRYLE